MDFLQYMNWIDGLNHDDALAAIHYAQKHINKLPANILQVSSTEVNKPLRDKWLLPTNTLINIANKGLERHVIDKLRETPATEFLFSVGALKKEAARQLIQFIILHNGGAINFSAFKDSLTTWLGPNGGSRVPPQDGTLRTWLSNWQKDGTISYPPGKRGLYTLTEAVAIQSIRDRNPMLKGFELDKKFPVEHRISISSDPLAS